jgi:hypothetical protein
LLNIKQQHNRSNLTSFHVLDDATKNSSEELNTEAPQKEFIIIIYSGAGIILK